MGTSDVKPKWFILESDRDLLTHSEAGSENKTRQNKKHQREYIKSFVLKLTFKFCVNCLYYSSKVISGSSYGIMEILFRVWPCPTQNLPYSAGSESGSRTMHCNENPFYVFPEKELGSLSPNIQIHVSVSDLYVLRIDPHIFLLNINRSQTHECGNWD